MGKIGLRRRLERVDDERKGRVRRGRRRLKVVEGRNDERDVFAEIVRGWGFERRGNFRTLIFGDEFNKTLQNY